MRVEMNYDMMMNMLRAKNIILPAQ